MMMNIPRGLRNNNPGNIRVSGDKFQGEVLPSQDKAFKQFRSMAYGYRAMFVLLRTYYNKYGLKSIRQMIGRWAPPSENHTENYVNYVARYASLSPDEQIDLTNKDQFCRIVAGMSRMENGVEPKMSDVEAGYSLL